MTSIFDSQNPWLDDLRSDESFIRTLQRECVEIHEFDPPGLNLPRAVIPADPNNLFPLKIRFADMVRGCIVPQSLDIDWYEVDDHTLRQLALLAATIDHSDELESVLYNLALRVFWQWFKFGKYHFSFDNHKFNQLRDEFLENIEREKILEEQRIVQSIPKVDSQIAEQSFDWWGHVRSKLEDSHRCNRGSECHHQDHDEHGASEHTYTFMIRAFSNFDTIGEFILQERAVLLQIKNNQTKWVKKVLRYTLLYLQEIRRITNEKLDVKIPDDVNFDLYQDLQLRDWFVDPRTFIRQ